MVINYQKSSQSPFKSTKIGLLSYASSIIVLSYWKYDLLYETKSDCDSKSKAANWVSPVLWLKPKIRQRLSNSHFPYNYFYIKRKVHWLKESQHINLCLVAHACQSMRYQVFEGGSFHYNECNFCHCNCWELFMHIRAFWMNDHLLNLTLNELSMFCGHC